jgi:acyl carrier protein
MDRREDSALVRVREIVLDVMEPAGGRSLAADADLWANGLSSLGSVSLLVRLEDEFDIEFPHDALERSTFGSIDAIAATVLTLLG